MKESTTPRWLLPTAIDLQVSGFLIFLFVSLLGDPQALKSSIYTYYQSTYYVHLSAGKLPWIQFNVEYPPLAVYGLLFPAYAQGLSVLTVSLLRACASTVLTILVLTYLLRVNTIESRIKVAIVALTSLLACLTPLFYHGVFDWTIYLTHLMLPLTFVSLAGERVTTRATWWLVWLGASIKLLPLFAAPFLAVGMRRAQCKFMLVPLVIVSLVHLPFVVWGWEGMRFFVAYHRLRGIDCFSIYSTALLTFERLGGPSLETRYQYGALEVFGPLSAVLAKLSLPLFLVVLAGLWLCARRLPTINHRLGMYFVAILLYPAISKVSQHNYVVWSVSALCALWLLGFNSKRFFAWSVGIGVALILIGWFQIARFDDYLLPQTSWALIGVSWLRFASLFAVSVLAIREIIGHAKVAQPSTL